MIEAGFFANRAKSMGAFLRQLAARVGDDWAAAEARERQWTLVAGRAAFVGHASRSTTADLGPISVGVAVATQPKRWLQASAFLIACRATFGHCC